VPVAAQITARLFPFALLACCRALKKLLFEFVLAYPRVGRRCTNSRRMPWLRQVAHVHPRLLLKRLAAADEKVAVDITRITSSLYETRTQKTADALKPRSLLLRQEEDAQKSRGNKWVDSQHFVGKPRKMTSSTSLKTGISFLASKPLLMPGRPGQHVLRLPYSLYR
jgi:hypothetical protein